MISFTLGLWSLAVQLCLYKHCCSSAIHALWKLGVICTRSKSSSYNISIHIILFRHKILIVYCFHISYCCHTKRPNHCHKVSQITVCCHMSMTYLCDIYTLCGTWHVGKSIDGGVVTQTNVVTEETRAQGLVRQASDISDCNYHTGVCTVNSER